MYENLDKLQLVATQRDDIQRWLDTHAPYAETEQKQLDAGTAERAYWHHGYQAALTDILNLLTSDHVSDGSAGTLN